MPNGSSFWAQRLQLIQRFGTFFFTLVPFWKLTHLSHSLLKRALELNKPVLYLNVGPTRADGLPGVDKLEVPTGVVMSDVVYSVL